MNENTIFEQLKREARRRRVRWKKKKKVFTRRKENCSTSS